MVQDSEKLIIKEHTNHINSNSGVPRPQESWRFRVSVEEAGRSYRELRETPMEKDC